MSSPEEVLDVIDEGKANRHVAVTSECPRGSLPAILGLLLLPEDLVHPSCPHKDSELLCGWFCAAEIRTFSIHWVWFCIGRSADFRRWARDLRPGKKMEFLHKKWNFSIKKWIFSIKHPSRARCSEWRYLGMIKDLEWCSYIFLWVVIPWSNSSHRGQGSFQPLLVYPLGWGPGMAKNPKSSGIKPHNYPNLLPEWG